MEDKKAWVVEYIARVIGESSDIIDTSRPITLYDFDSIDAVNMAYEMEKNLNMKVSPDVFWRGNTSIDELIAGV